MNGATNDRDIVKRSRLFIDVDTLRPEHEEEAATDAEKGQSKLVARAIRAFLSAQRWPDPIILDSGNGWHLYCRIDLANDDVAKQAIKRFLKALSAVYTNSAAKIDPSVYNASRYGRVPGTWSRRGPNTPERPWRKCKLLQEPEEFKFVGLEQIHAATEVLERRLTDSAEKQPFRPAASEASEARSSPSTFTLRATNDDAGRAYVKAAIEDECQKLASCPPGAGGPGRNNTLNTAAFNLGQLVHLNLVLEQEIVAALTLAAFTCGLPDDEAARHIRHGLEDGKQKPRQIPEQSKSSANSPKNGHEDAWALEFDGAVAFEGSPKEFAERFQLERLSARRVFPVTKLDQLMRAEFPEPNWAVAGLLAEGLNLLAGAPKSGKSMMALNLALTVAGGGQALGNIRTIPGDVLYLSLEDQERRVQFRARKMGALIGPMAAGALSIVTKWPRMDQGGVGALKEWLKRCESPRLIIVDVLQKFRPMLRDRGNSYEQDSQHMYAMKEFADEHKVTMLVLHHTRKAKAEGKDADEFELISGTQGLGGGCDGLILMKRMRRSNDATISIVGRDGPDEQLALRFEPDTLTWTSLGTAEAHLRGEVEIKVTKFMEMRRMQTVFVKDIAEALGISDNQVRPTLHRLSEKGIVKRHGNGWMFPGEPVDQESS